MDFGNSNSQEESFESIESDINDYEFNTIEEN
jgi:hypothetical protein